MSLVVVKVGGSLFDLPDLGARLRAWLDALREPLVLLVPGGGPGADAIRAAQRTHGLGDEDAHWLALRAVTVNAHFLAALLKMPVVGDPLVSTARGEGRAILDGHAFARADEMRPDHLPHGWAVTSDSLAARAARVAGARRLVLLKSITIPDGTDWADAGRRGWVDEAFADVVGSDLVVNAINFRAV